MKLNFKYFTLTAIIFLVEVYLALYVRDQIFRPFVGDLLVVVLIYCSLRFFWDEQSKKLILAVCLFAFTIEFIQYFDPIGHFGLAHHKTLSIVVGRTFSWLDLLAYSVGSLANLGLRRL